MLCNPEAFWTCVSNCWERWELEWDVWNIATHIACHRCCLRAETTILLAADGWHNATLALRRSAQTFISSAAHLRQSKTCGFRIQIAARHTSHDCMDDVDSSSRLARRLLVQLLGYLLLSAGSDTKIDSFVRGMIRAVTSHRRQQHQQPAPPNRQHRICLWYQHFSSRPPADDGAATTSKPQLMLLLYCCCCRLAAGHRTISWRLLLLLIWPKDGMAEIKTSVQKNSDMRVTLSSDKRRCVLRTMIS